MDGCCYGQRTSVIGNGINSSLRNIERRRKMTNLLYGWIGFIIGFYFRPVCQLIAKRIFEREMKKKAKQKEGEKNRQDANYY